MHGAARARGGIGWFGWLLIIIGLCATIFNLALYYRITHPQDGGSDSSSPDTSSSSSSVVVHPTVAPLSSLTGNAAAGSADGSEAAGGHHHHHHRRHHHKKGGGEEAAAAPVAGGEDKNSKNNKHHHQHAAKKHHQHQHQHQHREADAANADADAAPTTRPPQHEVDPLKLGAGGVGGTHKDKMNLWDDTLKKIQQDGGGGSAAAASGAGEEHHHHRRRHHAAHHHGQDGAAEDKKKVAGGDEQHDDAAAADAGHNRHHEHHQRHHGHHHGAGGGGENKDDNAAAAASSAAVDQQHHGHHHAAHKRHHAHHHHGAAAAGDGESGSASKQHKENGELGGAGAGGGDAALLETVPPLADKSTEAPPSSNNNKPLSKKARHRQAIERGRAAFHIADTTAFSPVSYAEASARYSNWTLKKNRLSVEQSSNHFEDIVEAANMGVLMPEDGDGFFDDIPQEWDTVLEEQQQQQQKNTASFIPCDPDDSDFTPEKDAACIAYLRNPRNWVSIKVMSSILSTGRTIKFKVFLRHPASSQQQEQEGGGGGDQQQQQQKSSSSSPRYIAAIVKVSQKKFLLEPASEVEAFLTDRHLNLRRVPPIVWAPVPLKFLRAACGTVSAFYSNWFLQFVEQNRGAKLLQSRRGAEREHEYLNVSLQLWMNDVHDADATSIKPSIAYEKYLKCSSSSIDHNDHNDGGGTADSKYRNPSQWSEIKNISLAGLSDISLFDFIIGNSDRWFGHNMFAIHGTSGSSSNNNKKPKFLFLDQGSSFYSRAIPAELIYHRKLTAEEKERVKRDELKGADKDDANTRRDLCRFRRSTALRILEVGNAELEKSGEDFYSVLRRQMPGGIFHVGSSHLLKAAKSRLEALVRMIESCRKSCGGDENVFIWE